MQDSENSTEQVAEAPQSVADEKTDTLPAPQPKPVVDEVKTPVPATAPREPSNIVVETVTVAEKPVRKVETTDIVETPERLIERKETVETTERVVDQVEVDEKAGRTVEQIEVVERTEKTVDTIAVDKTTGAAVETIVRAEPVEREVESVTVITETAATSVSRDPARLFVGPDHALSAEHKGLGILAIRADTPPSEQARLAMICEAFTAPLPDRPESETIGMVTVWPVSSTAHAEELNSGGAQQTCANAVERYGLAEGRKAIIDTERTGWILDNRGPYLLAWSPPGDKGTAGALVLLVDLSGVTKQEAATAIMQRWSSDIERNSALWAGKGWDVDLLRPIITSWREDFGARTLMLLGPVGG
ncbi:hypothetical protein [Hoeflea sp.]|uniref:hypothetical protein n=1 Tax=Hoeflea sp. TaxID=1940281 RepID=UPI003B015474